MLHWVWKTLLEIPVLVVFLFCVNLPTSLQQKSVLHIEGDALWGMAVKRMINAWRELHYIGVATTAAQGLALCHVHQPDIVLLDLQLPDADGFDVVVALASLPSPPRVLLLTVKSDEATLYRAHHAPIAGMVWKACHVHDTLRLAIGEALAGRKYFPADVRAAMRIIRSDPAAFFKILSERELSLLPLLSQGFPDVQIAVQTGLSPATVKSHRQHIMAKLDLHRTADLIRWAAAKGFVDFLRPQAGRSLGRAIMSSNNFH
jgi:two-component system, LuxR family, secretion system response regulator SsrB